MAATDKRFLSARGPMVGATTDNPACTDCWEHGDESSGVSGCFRSRRPCGHHCNHSWSHDSCCWCLTTWDTGISYVFWRLKLIHGRAYILPSDLERTQVAGTYPLDAFLSVTTFFPATRYE